MLFPTAGIISSRFNNWVLRVTCLGAAVLCLASAAVAQESNWGKWRGPLGTGVAPDANPPTTWSETQNIQWKVKIPGRGTSTPIVWGNQVFLQTAVVVAGQAEASPAESQDEAGSCEAAGSQDNGGEAALVAQNQPPRRRGRPGGGFGVEVPKDKHQFTVIALDRRTGKTLWQKVAREEVPHEGHHRDHGFSSYSPVTDGQHLIASFGSRGLHCFDLRGNLIWQKDLGQMRTKNSFGEGSSPALHGNTVIVNWDHEGDDFIAAFDKRSGEELWRQPRDEQTSWATPLVVEHDGRAQVVTAATKRVRSYDLATGKLIWETEGLTSNSIPTPVAGEGIVYLTSGFGGSKLVAVRLGHEGDLTGTEAILFTYKRTTPYVPSPLLYDDKLYIFDNRNQGILSCLDAKSGQVLIEPTRIEELKGGVYASPVGADGRIYLVGRNGATVVIKLAKKLEILATNALDDRIDASPAIVGDQLFLRGHENLYCIREN